MRIDNLRCLLGTMTFSQFRELAREYVCFRGYGKPVITDGWNDGGSDLRVYQSGGLTPRRIAIQTSVQEKDWKTKLKGDARKALVNLGCGVFLYVTNRRLADAEYQPIADELLQKDGISCMKADGDSLAQYVIDEDKLDWLFDLMGISFEGQKLQRSIRQEVTDAFVLFSDEAEDYRRVFLERAIMVAAKHSQNRSREKILHDAHTALGLQGQALTIQLSGTFDSLLSRGILVKRTDGGFELSKQESESLSKAYLIRDAQWIELLTAIQAILRKHCPPAVSNDNITKAAQEVASRIGQVLRAYRDYQVKILEDRVSDDAIRRKCIREANSIEAMLTAIGVAQGSVNACIAELSRLQETNPIVALLEAGETYRRLMAGSKQDLLNALGQSAGAAVVLDTSVLIPFLCGKLNGEINDPAVVGAIHLVDDAGDHACPVYAPSVYIEEAAAHLIMAGRFEPIILSEGRSDVRCSENAFVSYFATSDIDVKSFRNFLTGFGYRGQGTDFYRHRDSIIGTIGGLLRRYGVKRQDIEPRRLDQNAIRDSDSALGHVYHQLQEERPEILFTHDSHVLAAMKMWGDKESKAHLLATWDRCLQIACQSIHELVLGLDPLNAAELLELATAKGERALDIELIMHLGDKDLSLSSRIWDALIEVEREDLSDADLLAKARDFKQHFLARQQSDSVRTRQIIDAWRQWKAAAGERK